MMIFVVVVFKSLVLPRLWTMLELSYEESVKNGKSLLRQTSTLILLMLSLNVRWSRE